MTIEARMALALEELDELLGNGTAIEDALNAAALNQAVQTAVLLARATRTLSIEDRQLLCLAMARQKEAVRTSRRERTSEPITPRQLTFDF